MALEESSESIRFPLGQTCATQGALAELTSDEIFTALYRHSMGNWGDLSAEDIVANNRALRDGERLVSAYHSVRGVKFYVITEWNRSLTTVLLPQEY